MNKSNLPCCIHLMKYSLVHFWWLMTTKKGTHPIYFASRMRKYIIQIFQNKLCSLFAQTITSKFKCVKWWHWKRLVCMGLIFIQSVVCLKNWLVLFLNVIQDWILLRANLHIRVPILIKDKKKNRFIAPIYVIWKLLTKF